MNDKRIKKMVKNEKSTDLSIMVYSCNKNRDMWEIFLFLFKKYWCDCKYRLILLTDRIEDDDSVNGFDEVVMLDSSWYDMLMAGLKKAATPYVMLFMDDYLLCDYVHNNDIEKYIEYANKYNVANIRFQKSDLLKPGIYDKDKRFDYYKSGTAYSFTTQVGIWNVELLKKYINPDWSAWDFERKGSIEIKDTKHPLLGTGDYEFPYIEGARRGKWMRPGYDLCKKEGINIDEKKRPVMSGLEMWWIEFKGKILKINPTLIQRIYNYITK